MSSPAGQGVVEWHRFMVNSGKAYQSVGLCSSHFKRRPSSTLWLHPQSPASRATPRLKHWWQEFSRADLEWMPKRMRMGLEAPAPRALKICSILSQQELIEELCMVVTTRAVGTIGGKPTWRIDSVQAAQAIPVAGHRCGAL